MPQVIDSELTGPIGGVCPSEEDLLAFVEGELSEPVSETIIRHLARCQQCESSLARLAGQSSLAGNLGTPSSAEDVVREPECLRMQKSIRDFPLRAARTGEVQDEESTDKTRLSTDSVPQGRSPTALDVTSTFVSSTPWTIGRYLVLSVLGKGGYGEVYLAQDPQLDRQVAIKVAHCSPSVSRRLIDAFLAEAKVLAKLKHPGIVAVYDAGEDAQVGCYIVMEYVAGQSLKERMKAGKVPQEEAAKWIALAAEALNYVHKQELVHRDLKPSNLLLDSEGNLKVADFGLAIFEAEQRKHAGEIAGTIAYCSPEQIRGEVHHLDGRTDIWSLGVILYELLTGRRPFGGPNLTDDILHRPPKPPRQVDDTISPELDRLCLTCLAKDQERRPSTALDIAVTLRRPNKSASRIQPRSTVWIATIAIAVCMFLAALVGGALVGPFVRSDTDQLGLASKSQLDVFDTNQSYNVDSVAEPFVWVPLMEQPPRTILSNVGAFEPFSFLERRQAIVVDTSTPYFVGLGETSAKAYELQMDISKNSSSGSFGFILGYKSTPEANPSTAMLVLVTCETNGDCVVTREAVKVKHYQNNLFGISRESLNRADVPAGVINGTRLELLVSGGRIRRICWRGQQLDQLTRLQENELSTVPDCTGQFGVFNAAGTTTFQSAKFRITRINDND